MATEPQIESAAGLPSRSDGYEKRDANGKALFLIVGGLLLAVIGCEITLKFVIGALENKTSTTDSFTGARRSGEWSPSKKYFPRLQVSPALDLSEFRAQEDRELSNYAWINPTAGVVRIPVERAMDLMLQRGFAVRQGTNGSRLGPTPLEMQQQRTNATTSETQFPR